MAQPVFPELFIFNIEGENIEKKKSLESLFKALS
jgi:hypothetical protein